jgi:hypothetical protein
MRRPAALAVALAALLLAGCGKKGPPVAPETRLPMPVANLSASVVEGGVELRWTNPGQRVDRSKLRELPVARVFRTEDLGVGSPRPAMLARRRILGYVPVATLRTVPGEPGQPQPVAPGRESRLLDRQDLTYGRRYTYVVVTEDATGRQGSPSNRVSVSYVAPPGVPQRVQATGGEGQVEITWEPPARFVDDSPVDVPLAYEILRAGAADAPLALITPAPIEDTRLVDRNVENDRTYHYAVRGVRREGTTAARGEPSSRVAATPRDLTPPAPPTDLVAAPAPGSVRLSWRSSPSPDVRLYVVYRAPEGGDFVRAGTVAAPATVFAEGGLRPGTWRYAVSAQDAGAQPNESARTPAVTVTVP